MKWVKNKNINSKIQNSIICNDTIFEVKKFHESIPEYKATPIKRLKNFAKFCGLSEIYVKDESYRFGLNSFKVLGASYAIGKYIASKLNKSISEMSFDKLISDETKEKLGCLTFVSATDGNHGRGVAWAARKLGHNGIIYMPKGSTQNRVNHIRQMGAKVIVTEFNYDDTVRLAAREAKKNAWSIIQDTAWEDYADIPTWIMQGYSTIANEVVAQLKGKQPTHVFLQVGVGSFASMVADVFVSIFKKNPPKIVIVEPEESNCFYIKYKAVLKSTKIGAIIFLWTGLMVSILIIENWYIRLLLMLIGIGVSTHLLLLKTVAKSEFISISCIEEKQQ